LPLGSAAEVSVILLTLPDAFIGGILALILTGETLIISSAVGFIGLFGIAVQSVSGSCEPRIRIRIRVPS
jgi:cobalt-zinc-cadmium resistance protein CzcA